MIQVQDLIYTYPGAIAPTLKGLNFEVEKGAIFGFLGPSGAGKSTAQKVLYKILKGYKGHVIVRDKELDTWDKSYFDDIGVGFELPNHYLKLTAVENLKLFGSFYDKSRLIPVDDLFKRVGLEEEMDKPVEAYSKGMKMRLNFIRAIQHDPEILFFDEPTAGLDPVNAKNIRNQIRELKDRGKTVFITTHSMHTADELCDQVAFIADGSIRIIDTPSNLKRQYGKAAVLVRTESQGDREFPLKNLGSNADFLQYLKNNTIRSIRTLEASLDEVFIEVTGKSLTP